MMNTVYRSWLRWCVVLVSVVACSNALAVPTGTTKVLIAGGGPCGLLAAHCLLSRKQKDYDVEIIESREDPRNTVPGPRAYSLGLNVRGQSALRFFDREGRSPGLLNAVASRGVECDAFFLHIGKIKIGIRKPSPKNANEAQWDAVLAPPPPTLMVPRQKLCEGLLDNLMANHGSSGRLKVTFNSRMTAVDLAKGEATVEVDEQQREQKKYDFVIGSDGVQSVLRNAIQQAQEDAGTDTVIPPFKSEEVVLPQKYKIMLTPSPPGLESDAIHAMEVGKTAGYGLFLIPAPGNQTCALVAYTAPANAVAESASGGGSGVGVEEMEERLKVPAVLRENASSEEIKKSIESFYPLFGTPSDAAVAQLKSQRLSEARTVRCNRYHWLGSGAATGSGSGPGAVSGALLMGDAAHSTGGTLGQGANSALLDVVALDRCLDECQDDLSRALPLFSRRQTPEGLALWKLLQVPAKLGGPWKAGYQLSQLVKGLMFGVIKSLVKATLVPLARILPGIGKLAGLERFLQKNIMPTQNALSLTLTPFTQIVRANQFWIDRAMEGAGVSDIEYEES